MKTILEKNKIFLFTILAAVITFFSCDNQGSEDQTVPHEGRWGIYELNLADDKTQLIYNGSERISGLRLNHDGNSFVFSKTTGGTTDNFEEIYTMAIDGSNLQRLTDNDYLDVYPAWSPDGSRIAFLSRREVDLDIYVMDSDGSNVEKLYDSGTNDADIHWNGNKICFTRDCQIWIINNDGQNPIQITDPSNACQWGNAVLPFGDYDPRLSLNGSKIVFERLVDDVSSNGNYDLFVINDDGSEETALTNNGYTQGLANWSHSGNSIVYIVSAISDAGKYDMYTMNADGTNTQNITPDYYQPLFLSHSAIFSIDDTKIYFIGEWWE